MELCLFSSALPGWQPERVADAARAVGVSAVEWGIGPGEAVESPRAAARALRSIGVKPGGICIQGGAASLTAPARIEPFAALAADVGAPHVRVFAPAYRSAAREHARDGLTLAAEFAAAHGVSLLVETSPGTIAPSTAHARALVDGLRPEHVGVLYDPGNMAIEGHVDPALAVDELGPYLRHVHVKNIAWRRRAGIWRWQHAGLDAGFLDWRHVLSALLRGSYTGKLSLDHLGGRPSVALLRREVAFMRSLLSR